MAHFFDFILDAVVLFFPGITLHSSLGHEGNFSPSFHDYLPNVRNLTFWFVDLILLLQALIPFLMPLFSVTFFVLHRLLALWSFFCFSSCLTRLVIYLLLTSATEM